MFRGNSTLQEVKLNKNVTRIEDNGFNFCTSLQKFTSSDNLEYIGTYAFNYCTALTQFNSDEEGTFIMPSNLLYTEQSSFYQCEALKKVIINDNLTVMSRSMFYNCSKLEEVQIGKGVETIKTYCFNGTAIKHLVIPSNVKLVEEKITNGSGLESITIGDDTPYEGTNGTIIGENFFWWPDTNTLTSITLGNSVYLIASYSFEKFNKLQHLDLGNGIQVIGRECFTEFFNDEKLEIPTVTDIILPDSIKTLDKCFVNWYLNSVTYKGIKYTSKTQLRAALEANGVTVNQYAFGQLPL